MSTYLSPESIQRTKAYNSLPVMRKSFVTRKENRKAINDGLAICRNIGFESWSKASGETSWNISIVKELFEMEIKKN